MRTEPAPRPDRPARPSPRPSPRPRPRPFRAGAAIAVAATVAATLGLAPAAAHGQPTPPRPDSAADAEPRPRRPYWVTAGLVGTSDDLGFGLAFTRARTQDQIVTVRALALEEFCLFGCAPDRTVEVGALYGIAAQGRVGVFSMAAGASVLGLWRTISTGSSSPPFTRATRSVTVGIPVEGQLFLRPTRFLGLGVAAVANLNPERSFAGMLVGVQVGRLTARREGAPSAPGRPR